MSDRLHEYETVSRRSTVFSTKGVVCSSQPLASAAGLSILQKGGNCVDAAVATAAALNMVEPNNGGIGGDVFALYYDAKTKTVKGVNGSGKAPAALSLAKCRELLGEEGKGLKKIPYTSVQSATVPGTAGAWCDMVEKWGSGKLGLEEILEPAIRLGEDGFPIHSQSAYEWSTEVPNITHAAARDPDYPFLIDGQRAPYPGEIFKNPGLAETFKTLGREGKKGFYEGRVGQAIVDICKEYGGLMSASDLSSHETDFVEPISYTFGKEGHTVWECPPNGSGLAALMAFGILDALREEGVVDFEKLEEGGAEWFHVLIEAMRLAFADAHAFVADPKYSNVPVETMLSKPYLRERAKLFDPKSATAKYQNGHPIASGDTVYFTVADSDGNAVSMIMSNYIGFGTGIVPKGCGFVLQSRGSGFVLEEGHPNCLEGGKRPFHTIIPAMVTQGDELFMSFGVMGGAMQPQGHLQVLVNMLHHKHHPQKAIDAPRFCIGSVSLNKPNPEPFYNRIIALEHGVKQEVFDKLKEMGHDVEYVRGSEQVVFGKGQMILQIKDEKTGKRVWAAGSDPRGDGCAMAQY